MKYALDVTANFDDGERDMQRVEPDAGMVGITVTDLLEKYPGATSFVVTIVPKAE